MHSNGLKFFLYPWIPLLGIDFMLSNRYHVIEHIDLHMCVKFRDIATLMFTIATKMVNKHLALVTVTRGGFFSYFFAAPDSACQVLGVCKFA